MEGLLGIGLLLAASVVLYHLVVHRPAAPADSTPGEVRSVRPLAGNLAGLIGDGRPIGGWDGREDTGPGEYHGSHGVGGPRPFSTDQHTPRRASLLRFAGTEGTVRHAGGYAAVGMLTTGFSPMRDAIVELAVVRLDERGRVIDEHTSLVRPPALDDDGAATLLTRHGIAADDLEHAPSFTDALPDLLDRFAGNVVAAHHGSYVDQFLSAHLLRAGILPEPMPALSLAALAPRLFGTVNARSATLARAVGRAYPVPVTALDRGRLVAAVVPTLLTRYGESLAYPCPATGVPTAAFPPGSPTGRVAARSGPPWRHAAIPWMAEILAAAPMSALETNDARTAAYLDELTALLAQGRIVTEEARLLAGLLARSGSPAEEIRGVSARLLESFRQAAFAHPWISADQLRHLRAAAASLSQPTYFDDLIPPPAPPAPEPGSGSFARPVRKPPPQALPPRLQRCGNCLAIGHSITDCPRLGSRRTGPADRPWPTLRVDRIRPIGPA